MRSLRLSVWYPTDATDGEPVRYQGAFPAEGVWAGAPPSPGRAPVAVFSHGHQAYGEVSSFLMEHLASHGWVVVAPDHTGNLLWDGDGRQTPIYLQRPIDVAVVLDVIEGLPADHPLADRIGDGRLLIGHSFGGYTAHAVSGAVYDGAVIEGCPDGTPFCDGMTDPLAARLRAGFTDARFDALVSMAPGDYRLFADGLAAVEPPTLLMTGGLDDAVGAGFDDIWEALEGSDDLRVHLPRGGHNAFTDLAGALDPPGVDPAEDGWAAIRGTVLAFARWHVLHEDACRELLWAEVALGPEGVAERTGR